MRVKSHQGLLLKDGVNKQQHDRSLWDAGRWTVLSKACPLDVMTWRLGVGDKLIRLSPSRPIGSPMNSDRIWSMTVRAGIESRVCTDADSILADRIKSPKAHVKLTDLYQVDSSGKESLSLYSRFDAIRSSQCYGSKVGLQRKDVVHFDDKLVSNPVDSWTGLVS